MEVFSVVACVVGACVRVSSVVVTLVVIACVLGFSVGDFVGMPSEVVPFVVTTSVDDPVVAAMLGDEQIINFIQIQRNTFTQTQECNKVFDPNISNEKIMRLISLYIMTRYRYSVSSWHGLLFKPIGNFV
jgi:hypothetical protein